MFNETFIARLPVEPRALWRRHSSLLLGFLCAGAFVVTVLSTLGARSDAELADYLSAELTRTALLSTSTHDLPAADFAEKLPSATPSAIALQILQRACADAGVALVVVQIRERASTPESLARLEAVATLHGTYPATQRALKEFADRYADRLTATRLRMRRGAQVGEVETQVTFSLWGAPTPTGSRR